MPGPFGGVALPIWSAGRSDGGHADGLHRPLISKIRTASEGKPLQVAYRKDAALPLVVFCRFIPFSSRSGPRIADRI